MRNFSLNLKKITKFIYLSIDIWCILKHKVKMVQQTEKNERKNLERLFRSPTLETVRMIEETIKKYSGEFKKTQLWEKLPRKVIWSTYLIVLDYLEEINKIITAENGVLVYIWNPELVKKYLARKTY